jgi:formamidopyrimidine-DNA glycosylase
MPELPEVEVMTRNLRAWLGDGPVRLELLDPRLLVGELPGPLPLTRVWRRAKYTVLEGRDQAWVLHFRMTGKVVPDADRPGIRARLHGPERSLAFVDRRCLGQLFVIDHVDAFFEARSLGPEPYPEPQEGSWWAQRFARKRGPIKPALLDQSCVAGLGNIAASEILHRAGLDPRTPTPELEPEDWDRLARAAHRFLHDVVAWESGEEILFLHGDTGAANPFAVYGREGEEVDGGVVRRIVQSGRSSFFVEGSARSSG